MLVRFPQPLVIAEYFNYDRFGEIVLALPARRRDAAVHRRPRSTSPAPRRTPAPTRQQPAPDHARRRPERAEPARAAPPERRSRSRSTNTVPRRRHRAEHGRRARLRLQPVPRLPDRAGRLHVGQPAPGGARAGRRRPAGRRDEHAQLLPHARLPDGRRARQHVRPGAERRVPRRRRRPARRVHPPADQAARRARRPRRRRHRPQRAREHHRRRAARRHRRPACPATPTSTPARSAPTPSRSGIIYRPSAGRRRSARSRCSTRPTIPRFIDTQEPPGAGADVPGQRHRRQVHRRRQPLQVEGLGLHRRRRPRPRRRPGQLQRDPHATPPRRSSTGWPPTRPAAATPTS